LVSRTAKIFLDPKAMPIECTVIDLSAGGACIELSKPDLLVPTFEFLHGGLKRTCNLAWRRGFRAGISFTATVEKSGLSSGLSRRPQDRR